MKFLVPQIADLELLGRTPQQYVHRIISACLWELVGIVVVVVSLYFLGVDVPFQLTVLVFVGSPIATVVYEKQRVIRHAEHRRLDLDLSVSVFLDLVNVLLAGGAGVETALLAAAGSGDGWGFSQIRLSIARSQSARLSYWDGLRELGRNIGVSSLEEVANSVQLAGEHGARVRQSLSNKALALRHRNLARIEHDAERRTEQMGLPIVLLFLGFILLIGYPAFVSTVGAL